MTLEELLEMIESAKGKELPTAKQLRNEEIFISKKVDNANLNVYQSGFALYEVDGNSTVFKCDYCYGYTYYGSEFRDEIPYDYFLHEEWWVRLLIEGEDRLHHNRNAAKERFISFYPEEIETISSADSIEDKILFQIFIEDLLDTLTPRQKEVFSLYYQKGYSEDEIAKQLSNTHQAVSFSISAIKKKAKKLKKKYF